MAIEDAVVLGALLPQERRQEIPEVAAGTGRVRFHTARELQEMILECDALKAAQNYLGMFQPPQPHASGSRIADSNAKGPRTLPTSYLQVFFSIQGCFSVPSRLDLLYPEAEGSFPRFRFW
ncbi:hypothetical protein FB45DRAFT_858706 [Roridomyces roridus]|uniref:Uncharacterized protein n=1 Tax=Roridomyces roridus TaxID=1738132 RepID=A0AAD7CHX6_9AGAR|nr:hypothetical protein FB45DRAFT_858706 [Roridomyces roridus]